MSKLILLGLLWCSLQSLLNDMMKLWSYMSARIVTNAWKGMCMIPACMPHFAQHHCSVLTKHCQHAYHFNITQLQTFLWEGASLS